MKPKSLSRSNVHLRGPNALFLHARNVATSTAVETGKPVEQYITRCLSRLQGGRDDGEAKFNPPSHSKESPGK